MFPNYNRQSIGYVKMEMNRNEPEYLVVVYREFYLYLEELRNAAKISLQRVDYTMEASKLEFGMIYSGQSFIKNVSNRVNSVSAKIFARVYCRLSCQRRRHRERDQTLRRELIDGQASSIQYNGREENIVSSVGVIIPRRTESISFLKRRWFNTRYRAIYSGIISDRLSINPDTLIRYEVIILFSIFQKATSDPYFSILSLQRGNTYVDQLAEGLKLCFARNVVVIPCRKPISKL